MVNNQRQEEALEKELQYWEDTTQSISVISFSFDAYQRQKDIVETSRSQVRRNLDALKQSESDTDAWYGLLLKTEDSLKLYKQNVKILCG